MIKSMFEKVNADIKSSEIVPLFYKGVQFIKTDFKYVVAAFGEPFIPHYWKLEVNETVYYLYRTGEYFYVLTDLADVIDSDIEEILTTIRNEQNAIWSIADIKTESGDHYNLGYFKHEPSVLEVSSLIVQKFPEEVYWCGCDGDISLDRKYNCVKDMIVDLEKTKPYDEDSFYLGLEFEIQKLYLL